MHIIALRERVRVEGREAQEDKEPWWGVAVF
jgi:hypothetical protein